MTDARNQLFKALGDPTRRALFERLCRDGTLTVTALVAGAGVSQPAVSKHLAMLKRAGLVQARAEGRTTFYAARAEGLAPLADWTRDMSRFWDARFDSLATLLTRMDQ